MEECSGLKKYCEFDFLTIMIRLRRGNIFFLLTQEYTISSGDCHIACFKISYKERKHGVLFKDEKQTENNLTEKRMEEYYTFLNYLHYLKPFQAK